MAKISGPLQVSPQDLLTISDTAQTTVGALGVTADGRKVRYVKAGASNIAAGVLLQGPAEVTAHQNLTPVAASAGATQVTVALGATAATLNQYAGGYMVITVTPGVGEVYTIKSNPAAALSTSMVVTLEEALKTAITTSTRIDLVANPYNGVIINPTTASGPVVGASIVALTASYFGWIVSAGPASILNDGGSTVGTNVSASNGSTGAVEAAVTSQAAVGYAMTGIATTENGAIFLTID